MVSAMSIARLGRGGFSRAHCRTAKSALRFIAAGALEDYDKCHLSRRPGAEPAGPSERYFNGGTSNNKAAEGQMKTRVRLLAFAIVIDCAIGGPPAASAQHVTSIVPDGRPHTFAARDHQFIIDDQPTMLVAGEMHFGRVLPEDWDTRLKQAKAMGLNTVSFYLFWNMCEPRDGEFQFSGMTDVRQVLKLCQQNGLWAILRPGPYCCAEIEYGGIPWWTLKHLEVKIRTTDPQWLAWCRRYLEQVYKQVGDLEVTKGGPLLMVQIDNEIGITQPTNNDYMVALTKIFKDVGFGVQLFTCDPAPGFGVTPACAFPA